MNSLSILIVGVISLSILIVLFNTVASWENSFNSPLPQKVMDSLVKDINGIKKKHPHWTPDLNYLIYVKREDLLPRVGSNIPPSKLTTLHESKVSLERGKVNRDKQIPDSFDTRKNWPHCAEVIGNVYDQSNCESNWAVATAAAFSSRVCIASYEKHKLETLKLSAEDLMTCCHNCRVGGKINDGCDGGYVDEAWIFISQHGLVSGGNYGSLDTCKPYPIAPCPSTPLGDCSKERPQECRMKCTNNHDYKSDKKYGQKPYFLDDHEDVQRDIMTNGPLTASFRFSDDFPFYKKGIFSHVYGSLEERYHTAVVIGWGSENGIDYWLAMNTWNPSWGEDGTFRVQRIDNNCRFGFFMGSVPKID